MKENIFDMIQFAILAFILAAIIIAVEVLFGAVSGLAAWLLPGVEYTLAVIATTFLLLAIIIIAFMLLSASKKWK
jgi:hypothetical protein